MTVTATKIPALRFPEFEGEWEEKRLGEVAIKITDGTHDTPQKVEKGVPYLTAIHISDGKINYEGCYYLLPEDHAEVYKRCNPEKGDLLMVNIGAGTATCALVEVDYQFSLKNVALIKPDREKINPLYLAHYQRIQTARLFIQLTSGGAQPFLSLKAIAKLKIHLPPLSEQQKIATFLTTIDTRIHQISRKKALLEQYKKGVMQQVLSQEIRFKDEEGKAFPAWEEKELGELLKYEQPTKYIVDSTEYRDDYPTPVLTAGKTFILGFTDETKGVFNASLDNPVIIFDDFTTAFQFVSFPFKVKSSAMKILKPANSTVLMKFVFEVASSLKINLGEDHKRYWISEYSKLKIPYPSLPEQRKIAAFLSTIDRQINLVSQQLERMQTFKKGLLQQMFV